MIGFRPPLVTPRELMRRDPPSHHVGVEALLLLTGSLHVFFPTLPSTFRLSTY